MKRSKFLVLFLIICGSAWILSTAPQLTMPDVDHPLVLYSNQSRHDLHKLFVRAIDQAKSSLHVVIYALTDPKIMMLLEEKSSSGIKISIRYDSSATPSPPSESIAANLPRGLMHRKILVTDAERVFIGSANFTTTSLKIHDNLVAGLYHPGLAQFLSEQQNSTFSFSVGKTKGEIWLLPSQSALNRLIDLIGSAKKEIFVAMFTLTHPELADALIAAFNRGVDVRVALDHYTAEGASAPIVKRLRNAKIPLLFSQGQQLFHHKWASIDRSTLIMGSANWTRAAFSENEDCLLILQHLKFEQKKQIRKIWNIIEIESVN